MVRSEQEPQNNKHAVEGSTESRYCEPALQHCAIQQRPCFIGGTPDINITIAVKKLTVDARSNKNTLPGIMSHSCEQEHHECSPPPPETNASQSLYDFIDTAKTVCLNCVGKGNSGTVAECLLKSQEQKFNVSSYIESDADCQVLVHIPFTSNCRIFSVIIRCNQAEDDLLGSPKTIKLYKNFRKNIDFDTVKDMKPTHHFENPQNVGLADPGSEEYIQDESSFVEHHLPRRHFQNCHSLTLLIDDNWAADEDLLTRCYYLELRGECSGNLPAGDGIPLMAVYEAAPSPLDHKKLESEQETTNLGM